MIYCVKNNWLDDWLKKEIAKYNKFKFFYYNINYDDRVLVGDDPYDIKDIKYGYHNVQINQDSLVYHGTYIIGLLNAKSDNNIGINGISNNIKVMPIVISSNGDEYDKDIALAIRYAVDNGANVINMSSKKYFFINQEWVQDTLKYAEKNNVLFVNSVGNKGYNVDAYDSFPTDVVEGKEIVNNFINVGSTTYNANKKLVSDFSNYGKENVDLFAPGDKIYTTSINDKYRFKSGTSLSAPMVSGVAALIMSYYPNLKAHEVKEIILASGISYNIDVLQPIINYNDKPKLVPFSSLSKSGKILNAYNALLYAKNYKKWKAGKWPKK